MNRLISLNVAAKAAKASIDVLQNDWDKMGLSTANETPALGAPDTSQLVGLMQETVRLSRQIVEQNDMSEFMRMQNEHNARMLQAFLSLSKLSASPGVGEKSSAQPVNAQSSQLVQVARPAQVALAAHASRAVRDAQVDHVNQSEQPRNPSQSSESVDLAESGEVSGSDDAVESVGVDHKGHALVQKVSVDGDEFTLLTSAKRKRDWASDEEDEAYEKVECKMVRLTDMSEVGAMLNRHGLMRDDDVVPSRPGYNRYHRIKLWRCNACQHLRWSKVSTRSFGHACPEAGLKLRYGKLVVFQERGRDVGISLDPVDQTAAKWCKNMAAERNAYMKKYRSIRKLKKQRIATENSV